MNYEFDTRADEPVFRPSAGRFFITPDRRDDRKHVFDSLRAPVATGEELIEKITAYVAATIKPDNRSLFLQINHLDEFYKFTLMAGIDIRPIEVTVNNEGHRFLRAYDLIIDPFFGLILKNRQTFAICDSLWGGFPYSGLTLKYKEIQKDWSPPAPWSHFTGENLMDTMTAAHLKVSES